ncbi:MAG: M56 family metallopeptidase [Lachnospiraceae bacterium]|nr:M56 family metallopeptidase [Lachnospiraceae bacterium]
MRQNLLFTMSLTGNMVFILYILLYPLMKRFFSLEWRYRILKIAIAFYLIPIPICKYLIMDIIHTCFPLLWEKASNVFVNGNGKYIIIINQNFVKFSSNVSYMLIILLMIAIISFAIIRQRIIQYWKWKRVCLIGSEQPTNFEQELFCKLKKEIGVKKKVEIICSEYFNSPMTSGVLSPVLLFPQWGDKMDLNQYEYMLRHELVHIKHHDLFIKYIGLLVMAVHWYNPFAYMIFHEISVISEMYCDSIVIDGKGEEERRKYGELILKLAVQNEYVNKGQFFIGMANSRSKWVYKRRILEMKKTKKFKTILPVVMTMFICMAGGITTFAYEPPRTVFNDNDYDLGTDVSFVIEAEEIKRVELPSDYFFVDDSGNIFDLSKTDKNNRTLCYHDFSIHGTLNDHIKDGKGGCITNSYEAKRCSICSDVKIGELKSTLTYKSCPH